ncbi:MAG: phosphatase PAP2 family protein [Candidatus Kapaibacterium sp.]|jgi:hypothetical protein|nr:phosphatase PAP2 family protein [Candidatus Kapabacteria bacterium]
MLTHTYGAMKVLFSAICLITLCLRSVELYAEDSTRAIPAVIWDDISTAFSTVGYAGNRLVSVSDYDLVHLGIASGMVIASSFVDESFRNDIIHTSMRGASMDKFTDIVNKYGDLTAPALLTVSIYGGGLLFDDEYVRTTGRMLGEALIIGGTLTTFGKFAIGRARPYLNEGSNSFSPFHWGDERWAFPSGHTTVAFTVSGVLSARIQRWWATAGLYGLAASTGFARMYKDKHWFSDIVLGAIVGSFATYTVVNAENERHSTHTIQHSGVWRIMPIQRGIAITYIF